MSAFFPLREVEKDAAPESTGHQLAGHLSSYLAFPAGSQTHARAWDMAGIPAWGSHIEPYHLECRFCDEAETGTLALLPPSSVCLMKYFVQATIIVTK
jgi:hypothetical protein